MNLRVKVTALLFVCYWFSFAQSVQHSVSDQEAKVLDVDDAYRKAMVVGDARKLAELFADDIVIVHSDGDMDSKVNFLDAISSGRLKLTSYERSDVRVRMFGSTALLSSKTTKSFTYRGGPSKSTDTSTIVFNRTGDQWKIVAIQNTPRHE